MTRVLVEAGSIVEICTFLNNQKILRSTRWPAWWCRLQGLKGEAERLKWFTICSHEIAPQVCSQSWSCRGEQALAQLKAFGP
jgi:hypothetical protein